MNLFRIGFCVVVGMGMVGAGVVEATTMCTVRYDILGAKGRHVYLMSRTGGDCQGMGVIDVAMAPDSVAVRGVFDGINADWPGGVFADYFITDFMHDGSDHTLAEGLAPSLELWDIGVTIEAPSPIPFKLGTEPSVRMPTVQGATVRLLYADTPYIQHNYRLRSAYADTTAHTILLITHSNWGIKENASASVGDGIMVLGYEVKKP